jgi:membrane associated rhomboid family serine protease
MALIGVNVAVFLFEISRSSAGYNALLNGWGIVPDQLRIVTLFTSMFLHGGWLHLLTNMLFLWVFGRNLEDSIGGTRFLAFYLLCGVLAAVVHVITNPYSRLPTVGASGAIAGVMGGFLVRFPRASIITLVPVFVFVTTMEIPAFLLLLYWLVLQFFSGLSTLSMSYSGGGVAWFAHIGGFVAGLVVIRLFPERKPKWRVWYEE